MSKKVTGVYERLLNTEENEELNVSYNSSIRFTQDDGAATSSKSAREAENNESKLFIIVFAVILIGIIMILLSLASISIFYHKCTKAKSHSCFYWNVKSKWNATSYIFTEAASRGFQCLTIGVPISVITSSTLRNLRNLSIVNEATTGLFQKTYIHEYYSEEQDSTINSILSKIDKSKRDCIFNMQEMAVEVPNTQQLMYTVVDKIGECHVDPKSVVRHLNESIILDEKGLTLMLNCMFNGSCENSTHWIIDGGEDSVRSQKLIQFIVELVNEGSITVSIHLERCIAISARSSGNMENFTKCMDDSLIPSDVHEETVKLMDKCEKGSLRAESDSKILRLTCMHQKNQTNILAACVDSKAECEYEKLVQTKLEEEKSELVYVSDDLTQSNTTKKFGFVVFKPSF